MVCAQEASLIAEKGGRNKGVAGAPPAPGAGPLRLLGLPKCLGDNKALRAQPSKLSTSQGPGTWVTVFPTTTGSSGSIRSAQCPWDGQPRLCACAAPPPPQQSLAGRRLPAFPLPLCSSAALHSLLKLASLELRDRVPCSLGLSLAAQFPQSPRSSPWDCVPRIPLPRWPSLWKKLCGEALGENRAQPPLARG